jgi:hypothetical protein
MASLEQIGSALKKAAAAGDEPAARALAKAYKQMAGAAPAAQAAISASPPPGAVPGSREYADWAAARARGGNALPPVIGSEIPDNQQGYDAALEGVRQADYPQIPTGQFQQKVKDAGVYQPLNPQEIVQNDQLLGFGDEISGLAGALAQGTMGHNPRQSYDALQKLQEARRNLGIEQNGIGGQAASVVGSLTSIGAAPGVKTAVNTASRIPQWLKDMAASGTTGAVLGGVQGFGSTDGDVNQRLEGAKSGAEAGGIVGTAAPLVIRAVAAPFAKAAQNAAVNAAIKNAPDASELSSVASKMFDTAKNSGVIVKPQAFNNLAHDLVTKANAKDIDPDLDGAAVTVYRRLVEMSQAGAQDPGALSISKIHNLRQKAQDVAFAPDAKPRTRQFAQDLVDGLDSLMTTGNLTGKPSNLLTSGPNAGSLAGDIQLGAISTWARAKKVGLIESALNAAPNYLSGTESGLRSQFKTLLNNKRYRALWTPVERHALQQVVNGGPITRALRVLGMFRGLAGVTIGGAIGGPAMAVAGGVAGAAGRKLTEAAAERAAERAAKIVATPNVPLPRPGGLRIPNTLVPLLAARQQGQ